MMETMPRWGVVCTGLLVLILVPVWDSYGALTPRDDHGEMAVDVEAFTSRVQAYVDEHRLADGSVEAVSGTTVPIMVMQFGYLPNVLRLRTGGTYTLEFAAKDVIHGFSLQMGTGSLNALLMPGMMTRMEITATQPGEYLFSCNEYCGIGHHLMSGKIVVEGPPASPPTRTPTPATGGQTTPGMGH